MSNATFENLWIDTQDAINDILQNEIPVTTDEITPTAKTVLYQNLCTSYVKYIQILRKLDVCYDQIVHPQKRRLIRTVLDASMGRIIELHNDMAVFKNTEFHFFDDILSDLKLSAEDIELVIPKYFLFERTLELQERERNFDEITERMGSMFANEGVLEEGVQDAATTAWDMLVLIQSHERGRQDRLKVKTVLDVMARQRRQKLKTLSERRSSVSMQKAVILIQKTWRGYQARKLFKKLREEEMIFLGMASPDVPPEESSKPFQMVQLVEAHRRAIQERYEYEFEDAVVRIRDRVVDLETGEMQEAMQDKIRSWFHEIMNALGVFPDYPGGEGSRLILEGKLPPEELIRRAAELAKADEQQADEAEEAEVYEPPVFIVKESRFVETITEESKLYEQLWRGKDESDNPMQRHDEGMIAEEKREEVKDDVLQVVDNVMQNELERLKDAVARDRGIKRPKTKAPKKKRGAKGKGKKKEKDLTPDRTLESLYEELVMNGIIIKFPKVSMTDFLGDYNYLGSYMQQNAAIEITPSLADIRRLVTQYCIFPLGCPEVHDKIDPITSILLVGPHGCGKKMLAHIVASEAGVTLFNLSADNLVDKYPGKEGLKMLLHLVKKVGTLLQPSVILVENAERMFMKKIPKEIKQIDPKRMKAAMPKFLNTITTENRILLIGATSDPSNSSAAMGKMYKKILMIPKPDFSSRCIFWRHFIKTRMGQHLSSVDTTLLAKLSDGYTAGGILQGCNLTLTDYRKSLHNSSPVQTNEFMASLAKINPIFKDEEDTLRAWYYTNTQLGYDYMTVLQEEGLI